MQMEFGWTADGAAWADAPGHAAHGQVRMGPRGLVQLLQTRLGLTRPAVDQAVRIAQYMQLIHQHLGSASEPEAFWPSRSFAVDPWSTARQLLRWRDAAVEAGWNPPGTDRPLPPRLAALRDVEAAVVVGMPGTTGIAGRPATLSPSSADDLVELLSLLEELERTGGTWPLGITQVTAQEDPSALPGLWPRLFAALARSGVVVQAPSAAQPTPGPHLEVVVCQDEWTAADVAARYLAASHAAARAPAAPDPAAPAAHSPEAPGGASLTLLAGADTTILDQALRRRGLPAAGAVAPSTARAHHQVLGLYLDVATAPVDVHQLAALLDLRVLPGADRDAEPIGLVPAAARRLLLRALTQEPGVGGPAWRRALGELEERLAAADADLRPSAEKALTAAQEIHRLVTDPLPADRLQPPAVAARLDWLSQRLQAVSRGDGDLLASLTQVRTLQAVLGMLDPATLLSRRTLQLIIDACGGSGRSPLAGAQVAPWKVTTRPAQVAAAGGTVLWWAPEGGETPTAVQWDQAEREALRSGGAHLIDPEQLAGLHVDAALRGLRTAGQVIAVLPGRRLEKSPPPSGLLAHLESARRQDGPSGAHRRSPESLITGGTWALGGVELPVRVPGLVRAEPPEHLHRQFATGVHLLPQRLSFTAAQTLVGCPLHWLLEHALGVRTADVAALPTGDRMIGTLVHAVVEQLVQQRWDDGVGGAPLRPPTDEEITSVFDRLVPQFASELDLPGHAAQRADVHDRTVRSLRTLFAGTARAGLRITGTEVRFSHPLTLPLAGGARTIEFVGSRDLDLRDASGRPTVIDLKWSRSRTRYVDLYETGDAVQLASYAWALDQAESLAEPAQVGYFLLHAGEFVAADRELDPRRRTPMDVRDSWERLTRSVTTALDQIAEGTAVAGCRSLLDGANLPLDAPYSKRRRALEGARAAARSEGLVAVDSYCATSEYAQLCGMTGDFR
ncbi:PD-(D/E)XK nuclease family protein [Brachybacterium muris]|uniref:PD-(D/E)XK nuclease family protein n=1 Tax=Brachybacterium muris TaxID=219301 RepID=UPI0021A8C7DF|nr:PD-(D/E)XK nuclease family protein [Brachybacterium muris]MCT1431432.1 PD-(D/E)XK nuclease family protein [Brachybacterium muris]